MTGDRYSDTSGLSEEDRLLVERIRAEREAALAQDPDAEDGLPPEKQDFPIGVRTDEPADATADEPADDDSGAADHA